MITFMLFPTMFKISFHNGSGLVNLRNFNSINVSCCIVSMGKERCSAKSNSNKLLESNAMGYQWVTQWNIFEQFMLFYVRLCATIITCFMHLVISMATGNPVLVAIDFSLLLPACLPAASVQGYILQNRPVQVVVWPLVPIDLRGSEARPECTALKLIWPRTP